MSLRRLCVVLVAALATLGVGHAAVARPSEQLRSARTRLHGLIAKRASMQRGVARARGQLERLDTIQNLMSDEWLTMGDGSDVEGTRYLSTAWHRGTDRSLEQ